MTDTHTHTHHGITHPESIRLHHIHTRTCAKKRSPYIKSQFTLVKMFVWVLQPPSFCKVCHTQARVRSAPGLFQAHLPSFLCEPRACARHLQFQGWLPSTYEWKCVVCKQLGLLLMSRDRMMLRFQVGKPSFTLIKIYYWTWKSPALPWLLTVTPSLKWSVKSSRISAVIDHE